MEALTNELHFVCAPETHLIWVDLDSTSGVSINKDGALVAYGECNLDAAARLFVEQAVKRIGGIHGYDIFVHFASTGTGDLSIHSDGSVVATGRWTGEVLEFAKLIAAEYVKLTAEVKREDHYL